MTVPVGRNDTQQAREAALAHWKRVLANGCSAEAVIQTLLIELETVEADLAVLEAERDTLAKAVQAYVDEMDAPARPRITERYLELLDALAAGRAGTP